MTKPIDPYSRVYWRVAEDERFETIFGNDYHFAAWVRLLMLADATFPTVAPLPATARKASVKALSDCGLIDVLPGGLYRVRGLKAERDRRGPRRAPDGTPSGPAPEPAGTLARAGVAETSKDETRRDEQDAPDAAVSFHRRTGEFPGPKILSWLNELSEAHGEVRLVAAIAAEPMAGRKVPDYLRHVRDVLRSEDHQAERSERIAEVQRIAEKRRPIPIRPVEEPEISDEEADRIARAYIAEFGGART